MLTVTSLICVSLGCVLIWQSMSWASLIARVLAWPSVTNWLIARYARPDRAFHIVDDDGSVYMERFIIFNRGGGSEGTANHGPRQYPWLPFSIRLHHIMQPDGDRHPHDHPSKFRTFCLRGWYEHDVHLQGDVEVNAGDTYVMGTGMFHRIFAVPPQGVWTLVIFSRRTVKWGFLVGDRKVPYNEYLAAKPKKLTAADWDYVAGGPDEERRG